MELIRRIASRLKKEPNWRTERNTLPWFDQPNALQILNKRRRSERLKDEDYLLLKKWVEDGYVILDDTIEPRDIDEMVQTLDSLWTAPAPIAGLRLLDVRPDPNSPPIAMGHAEVLALDPTRRQAMKTASNWRIHGLCNLNEAAKRIYHGQNLGRVTSLIFGKPSIPSASINFMYGSMQTIHQDMGVFHIYPLNYLIGAWIACEDISAESGPMFYYPKSHRVPFYSGFYDYPQTNLRTLPRPEGAKYHEYLAEHAKQFERKEFTPKKGQALLWNGMLLHGGSEIKKPGTSRKSYVIHYFTKDVDREKQVQGPFNW